MEVAFKIFSWLYSPIKNIAYVLFLAERKSTIAGHLDYFVSERWWLFGEWLEDSAKKNWKQFETEYLEEQRRMMLRELYRYKVVSKRELDEDELDDYFNTL